MSESSTTTSRSQRRASSQRSCVHTIPCLFVVALLGATQASPAQAQSWSAARARPLLRQLVSVDATGESTWPYGREDISGDGLSTFAADEAGTDLRSVYADADDRRVWLRAYLAADARPAQSLTVFFFADTDDRDQTGGPAFGEPLSSAWSSDPTPGGYERAIGVRGDGTLLGVFGWDTNARVWAAEKPRKDDANVELGRDEDPLRIGIREHGYVQIDVIHELSGLTASCAGNLFARTWYDATPARSFGDDDAEVFACRPATDSYGDPIVIRSVECKADPDCPNAGRCRDGVCLFASPCDGEVDCRADERCTAGSCIKVVDTACTASTSCAGLVCESGACVACSESGARACAVGLACSPDGTCVDADNYLPGSAGDGGIAGADAGTVRGGAFHCAVSVANECSSGLWLWGLAGAWLMRRRARREGRVS